MSIKEDEASNYWSGSRGWSEWSYFESGFDVAVDAVGCCFECLYKHTNDCPLLDSISEVDLMTYYCAYFDKE